jgi:hypothetical protein
MRPPGYALDVQQRYVGSAAEILVRAGTDGRAPHVPVRDELVGRDQVDVGGPEARLVERRPAHLGHRPDGLATALATARRAVAPWPATRYGARTNSRES